MLVAADKYDVTGVLHLLQQDIRQQEMSQMSHAECLLIGDFFRRY
jgi:hypothetical protein